MTKQDKKRHQLFSTFTFRGKAKDLLSTLKNQEEVFQNAMVYLENKNSDFMRVHWLEDADLFWYEYENKDGKTQDANLPAMYTEAFIAYA